MDCSPPSLSSTVKIEPVSDAAEIPALASLFGVSASASGDTFHELLRRYTDDPHGQLVEQLQAACSSTVTTNTNDNSSGSSTATAAPLQQQFVFKAVVVEETMSSTSDEDGLDSGGQDSGSGHGDDDDPGGAGLQQKDQAAVKKEKTVVVGMAHWTVGYIDLQPKVDPFEPKQQQQQQQRLSLATSGSAPVGTEGDSPTARAVPLEDPIVERPAAAAPKEEGVGRPFDFYGVVRRPVRNTYISQIRGKKHVYLRRIAVHPQYQRRGIARQLLQWGLDRADSEKLVSYLNARPLARGLYENAGFEVVNEVLMAVPGLEVPDMVAMVRQPRVRRRG